MEVCSFYLFIVIRYVLYIPLDIIKGTKRCGLSVFYMFILWRCFHRYSRVDHTRQSQRTERPPEQQCHGYYVLQQPSLSGRSEFTFSEAVMNPSVSIFCSKPRRVLPPKITKGLTQELNRLYSLFCSRNPEFEEKGGKVSIVAHSLGCVITYDIITGWDPVRFCLQEHRAVEEETDLRWMSYEEKQLLQQLKNTRSR